jgi:hypothetical protein
MQRKRKPNGEGARHGLLLPQIVVKDWMYRAIDVAVQRRQEKAVHVFPKAEWIREACAEKLEREGIGRPREA